MEQSKHQLKTLIYLEETDTSKEEYILKQVKHNIAMHQ